MRLRCGSLFLILVASPLLLSSPVHGQNRFRLKPGAEGKLCLSCHPAFEEKLSSKFVHTPVKMGECSGCHNPHSAAHGKLLSASPSKICLTCHGEIIPDKAASTHRIVVEGNCVTCHDPHASNNTGNLVTAGNALCVGCHKALGETIAKAKFTHRPVEDGCLNCHDPHGSGSASHLLKSAVPSLCVNCHPPDTQSFVRQHADYPVAKANCASCHDPHGSSTGGLLFDTVHAPVAGKRCSQCHEATTSAAPLRTRRLGFELCRGCHSKLVNETFSKNRIHWPLVDETGCLNCHRAHASPHRKLLNGEEATLCAACHQDTAEWQVKLAAKEKQEKAASKGRAQRGGFTHDPVQQGSCSTCHVPHASDQVYLMGLASIIEGCGMCHDWLKHTSHPMGEKYDDPRNRNLKVDCLSCHRSHGTGFRHMLTFPAVTDLCVQCHKQLRR